MRTTVIGLLAGGFVCAAIAAVTANAGRIVGVSLGLRPDTRSIAASAPPAVRQAWAARPPIDRAAQMVIIASLSLPEPKAIPAVLVVDPIKTAAVNIPERVRGVPDPLFDPIYTGAIAPVSRAAATASADAAAPVHVPGAATVRKEAPPPKTRLASLSPTGGLDAGSLDDPDSVGTAIYDITAQTVYLPNGEKLEAHSGLGSMMDDPRHVSQKNRGPTPPNTYKLKMREALFHGVPAIRLTPVSETGMFGRDGILAHTYMLGPSGQSNGCVSFRDYQRFLRAFQRGEFDRMVVVSRLPKPPVFASRSRYRSASNKTL